MLLPVALLYLQDLPNTLPHTAHINQSALQDVQMLSWPTYLPDLLSIENISDVIGHYLQTLPLSHLEAEV